MIVFVRHGRTVANAQGLLQGRMDPPLDVEGTEQAAAVARALATRAGRVGAVVSSPLARCRVTAEAIAGTLGVAVTVDDRWIEMDYGELDGTPLASVPVASWRAWRADPRWRPPGGESLVEVGERAREACEELARPAVEDTGDGGDVVVVSHVSPIKAAVAWALGVGDEVAWRIFMQPASITRVTVRDDQPTLLSFNETGHLPVA